MSTSEDEKSPTGEVTDTVELSSVLTGDEDQSGKLTGSVCIYAGPDFTDPQGCFEPQPGTCYMGDPPIQSARNNTDGRVHFYENACLQRPYFSLEAGQYSSRFPFPVRAIRQDP